MATKKTTETPVDITGMTIWAKLLAVRKEFYNAGIKKSGVNDHAEFMYFELEDIVPVATPIFEKYGLIVAPTFGDGNALARVVNIEKPEEFIIFEIPLQFIAQPAKFRMNEVQAVGATVTYYRRYLYMIILDLVEKDEFDGTSAADNKEKPVAKKPATTEERKEIKKSLTNTDGEADDLQKAALKAALKKLREIDQSKEEFVQTVAIKTDGFKKIKKSACEELILTVNEMIENYNTEEEWEEI